MYDIIYIIKNLGTHAIKYLETLKPKNLGVSQQKTEAKMKTEQKLEEDLVPINIKLEKNILKVIDLIYESNRAKFISRERTIEYLIKKGMHQTF